MSHAPIAITAPQALHGEGPVWDPIRRRLFWVDMMGKAIHALDPRSDSVESAVYEHWVCALAPASRGLLAAFAKELAWVSWPTGSIDSIVAVEPDLPGNRCNDGKRDPAGRFWIGTMSGDGTVPGAGSLYRLEPNGRLVRVLGGLTIANGMGWSPDARTMYFIDSPTREIWAFDFDIVDSSISRRRTVVRVPESLGLPDGMTVDREGCLWVAHWGPGCVCRWDPATGNRLATLQTGCPHTSSCAFGGDAERELFITTSQLGMDAVELQQTPKAGCLFRASVD
ncbi:MAG: SMP-30/gluconolactonase/LRE family protein [Candidatus Paceibacterota bacterium]|jgi:sugar lactone lactonase YvrE